MTADLAIVNAEILTMEPKAPKGEALAIGADRLLAVGSVREIRALCHSGTRIVNARGATVLPGFIESHMHLFLGAFSRKVLNLAGLQGTAELATVVRAYAEANPDEPLLIAQGAAYGCLDGAADPSHLDLDAICPDRPLLLQSVDFHNGWANSAALSAAGVLNGRDVGPGAEIEIGSDGIATGLLTEPPAVATVLSLGAHGGREGLGLKGVEPDGPVTSAERALDKALLRDGLAFCAAKGITSIINMDGNRYQAALLGEIEAEGDLICRVELPYHFTPGEPLEQIEVAEQMRQELASEMLWCGRIKLFMDGVLDMETAFRLHDYPGKPGERGAPLHDPARFAELAIDFDRRGFQISVHAIGDAAVRTVIDGYESARKANGPHDSRHRIEHIELIDPKDLPRLADLGIVASVMPPHPPGCEFPMEPTTTIIGRDQWPDAYRWRGLKEAGAPICFSSDWPIATLDPLRGMDVALKREPWARELANERLSFEDTLRAYTAGGAFAARKDRSVGRLAPGFKADVVVLDRKIDAMNLAQAAVSLTICDGTVTYEASEIPTSFGFERS